MFHDMFDIQMPLMGAFMDQRTVSPLSVSAHCVDQTICGSNTPTERAAEIQKLIFSHCHREQLLLYSVDMEEDTSLKLSVI